MPAAVSDLPPRKGPIRRYFIPLKAFSSGLEDSAASELLSGVVGGWAGWVVCSGFTALDCRSCLAWACAAVANNVENVTAKTNRTMRDAFLRKLSGPMVKVSPGKKWTMALWESLRRLAAKGNEFGAVTV